MNLQELRDEYEINIRALIITIFQQWRLIILCGLAGAILAAGFKYVRSRNQSGTDMVTVDVKTDAMIPLDKNAYGLSMTDTSLPGRFRSAIANYEDVLQKAGEDEAYLTAVLTNKAAIEIMQRDIADTKTYLENSLLAKSNSPEGVQITLLLQVDEKVRPEEAEKILSIYRGYLNSDETYAELAEKWDVDASYINEIVDYPTGTVFTLPVAKEIHVNGDEDVDRHATVQFQLILYGENREKAEELQDYVLVKCDAFAEENEAVDGCKLRLIHSGSRMGYNKELQEQFDNMYLWYAQMETLSTQYSLFVNQNADVIKKVEAAASRLEVETETVSQPESHSQEDIEEVLTGNIVSKRSLVKYGLVGGFAGMIVCMGILFMYYVLKGIVLAENEVNGLYRLRHLVTLKSEESSRRRTSIDKWLQACKEDPGDRTMDETRRYEVLETKVRSYADSGADRFLMVGTTPSDPVEEIAHKLGLRMKDCSFSTTVSLSGDKNSLDALENCSGVIMILNVAHSRHESVYKDIETTRYYGKEIIGTVAII